MGRRVTVVDARRYDVGLPVGRGWAAIGSRKDLGWLSNGISMVDSMESAWEICERQGMRAVNPGFAVEGSWWNG